ncbi:hypothetical protein BLI708_08665 [Bifidobacterium imperatoris]|uniref:Uncharacterized protein n=1 Tax=Bifidobacterium imperatoris TaxID=2020965 RepID=A0ABX7RZ50_9BIFI|nr:hypothetical protein [Bifidobacterium imperatoris]QSY57300.1 hypothetical protein BLI708_08665 [Bifidobacterium imperatoris]
MADERGEIHVQKPVRLIYDNQLHTAVTIACERVIVLHLEMRVQQWLG